MATQLDFKELQEFMPTADPKDWYSITAGQRVQVIKKDKEKGGVLQFGTEVITNRIANIVRQRVSEVDYTLVTIGGDPAKTRNLGNIYLRLKPIKARARDQFEVMAVIRNEILPPLATNLLAAGTNFGHKHGHSFCRPANHS